MIMPRPGPSREEMKAWKEQAGKNLEDDLDAAFEDLQDEHPGLDWSEGGEIQAVVSQALDYGFRIGQDYANRHPD